MARFVGASGYCWRCAIPWIAAILLIGVSLVPQVDSIEGIGLSMESLAGPGWRAEGVALDLDWRDGAKAGFRVSVRKLRLPGFARPLENVLVDCPRGWLDAASISCEEASVRPGLRALDRPAFRAAFKGDLRRGSLSIDADRIRLAGGGLRLGLNADPSGWHLEVRGRGLHAGRLKTLAKQYASLPEGWSLSGRLSPHIRMRGIDGTINEASWTLQAQDAAFADPRGDYLGEGLAVRLFGELSRRGLLWRGGLNLQLERGEILTPGFYLSPPDKAIEIKCGFSFDPRRDRLVIDALHYLHEGVLDAEAGAELNLGDDFGLQHLSLQTGRTGVQSVYGEYLQPTLGAGLLDNLAWKGQAELRLSYRSDGPSDLSVVIYDVHVDSPAEGGAGGQARPFGLYGVNGRLQWSRGGTAQASRLSWEGGHILDRLTLGPARIGLSLSDQEVRLLEAAEIPLLDGRLLVDRFSITQAPDAGMNLTFDGVLTPVSLQRLSRALGWPELAGKVSGVIPEVSYRDGGLQVAGNLLVRAFGGDILIRRLRVQDLFGVFPILNADLEFNDLDLEILTRTFSFGRITGKLEGVVRALQLEDWQPVAFDARFATPEDDDSRHRISQKAVDNIANLGGAGVAGALSRGFLRFFDDFGYKRLGISCRLHDGVCEMGGVSPAQNGYYLVEGGGIPRISIIGFNRRTDWPVLLGQLRAIGAADSPVVD